MPPFLLPVEIFSHKTFLFLPRQFSPEQEHKKFHVYKASHTKKKENSTRDINCDKIRKTKIGFVPSVINRKFGRYQTVWKAISFSEGGFHFELSLVIVLRLLRRQKLQLSKGRTSALIFSIDWKTPNSSWELIKAVDYKSYLGFPSKSWKVWNEKHKSIHDGIVISFYNSSVRNQKNP